MEGPFWKEIRGLGLSYGYHIGVSHEQGVVTFGLFKSTSIVDALHVAKAIIDEFAAGTRVFDALSLESAISTTIYSILSDADEPQAAAFAAFHERLHNHVGINDKLLKAVAKVTQQDVERVLHKYIGM